MPLEWAIRAAFREKLLRVTTIMAGLMLVSPVFGHHSDADLDMESLVTIDGTVTAFHWRNPHVYFTVETAGEGGEAVEWAFQMASIITVSRQGWTLSLIHI